MHTMKIKRFLLTIATLTLCLTACHPDDKDQSPSKEREIVYSIGGKENRETLTTEAEWDAIIDKFCDYAYEGQEVIFYNMNQQTYYQPKSAATPKEVTTFTTTNRNEMKTWMKEMEKQGKTVSVSYDRDSGTWSGTAYLNAPHNETSADCFTGVLIHYSIPLEGNQLPIQVTALQVNSDTALLIVRDGLLFSTPSSIDEQYHLGDSVTMCGTFLTVSDMDIPGLYVLDISERSIASLVGNWHLSCLSVTELDGGDMILSTEIYVPEMDNQSIVYHFNEDGSAAKQTYGPQGSNTEYGTWSATDDGDLCCDLFDVGGGCWNINWLSGATMIISRTVQDQEKGNLMYQMQFESEMTWGDLKLAHK